MKIFSRTCQDQYYDLDPSVPVDPYVLDDIYTDICSSTWGGESEEAAALALELAQHPRVNDGDRREYAYEAQERYEHRNVLGRRVVRGYSADLTRSHLPLVTSEDAAEGRASAIRQGSVLMKNWRDRYLADSRSRYKGHVGYAYELGACLVTNAMEPSLLAYPSLPRQDRNTRRIDGKAYKWDVTVESDGSEIEEGLYRIQVKSSTNNIKVRYHPDIHILVLGDQLPQKTDIYLLPEMLRHKEGRYRDLLGRLSGFILGTLAEKPPASRQLHFIR